MQHGGAVHCLLQMESLIARMQAEHTGVQVRTVKSFISKIPSVFTGKQAQSFAHLGHVSHILSILISSDNAQ